MNPQNEFSGSRILLVEDEEALAIGLEYNLTQEGYQVVRAADGREAVQIFSDGVFDLVILDLMLPYLDGFEVASRIREAMPQLPILVLTARKAAQDRIASLKLGADDYLTKPFHLEELLLRVQGMLRRKAWYRPEIDVPTVYRFGKNEINFDTLACQAGKKRFQITPQEAETLRYLITNSGRIVSRRELLEKVWRVHADSETRTVDIFMVRLRRYFEPDPKQPIYFKSVRGAGYMFAPE
jgi:DNA-binding response OmpR family regulator